MMSKLVRFSLIIILSLSGAAYAFAQQVIKGKVVGVTDGDTITVLDQSNKQHKIRFQGIDAPESRQDFGQKSKQNLSDMVLGKSVTVLYDKLDKYGRVVGKVLLDGKDVNLEQIKAGLAWHYKQYENEQTPEDRKIYSEAEIAARSAKIGLWSIPNPIAPWNFRYPQNNANSNNTSSGAQSSSSGQIIGNKNSGIYHFPNCPSYNQVSEKNRVYFKTSEEAEKAGYRKARNCP